jgi:hypothetical protein
MEVSFGSAKSIWKFALPIVLILLPVIVPIALYLAQVKKKEITFEVVSKSEIIDISESVPEQIEILFSGKKLESLSLVRIHIANSGDVPIRKTDFERALSIDFGKNSQVLNAEIRERSPLNLIPSVSCQGRIVTVEPLLLNSGDHFSLDSFVTCCEELPILDARIAGIKEPKVVISRLGEPKKSKIFVMCGGFVLLVFAYGYLASLFLGTMGRSQVERGIAFPRMDMVFLALATAIGSAFLFTTLSERGESIHIGYVIAIGLVSIVLGLGYQSWRSARASRSVNKHGTAKSKRTRKRISVKEV